MAELDTDTVRLQPEDLNSKRESLLQFHTPNSENSISSGTFHGDQLIDQKDILTPGINIMATIVPHVYISPNAGKRNSFGAGHDASLEQKLKFDTRVKEYDNGMIDSQLSQSIGLGISDELSFAPKISGMTDVSPDSETRNSTNEDTDIHCSENRDQQIKGMESGVSIDCMENISSSIKNTHCENMINIDPISSADMDLSVHEITTNDDFVDRNVHYVTFGPKSAWYVRWSDGASAWESFPQNLNSKLHGRNKNLPLVSSLSMSADSEWVTVFTDGSFATSGFPMTEKVKDAFFGDEIPALFTFAPAGGWLLAHKNGSLAWERLPTGLETLLKRRQPFDAAIQQISISGYGGCECEWEAIPKTLEKILIANIRHADPNIIVSLSLMDGSSYFVSVGETAEWIHEASNLRTCLQYAEGSNVNIPTGVTWEVPFTPPGSVE